MAYGVNIFVVCMIMTTSAFARPVISMDEHYVNRNDSYSGMATSYCSKVDGNSSPKCFVPNACDVKIIPKGYEHRFGAVPQKLLDLFGCGSCVEVSGSHGREIIKIVDTFEDTHIVLNMNDETFEAVTGVKNDRKNVTYGFVPCV